MNKSLTGVKESPKKFRKNLNLKKNKTEDPSVQAAG